MNETTIYFAFGIVFATISFLLIVDGQQTRHPDDSARNPIKDWFRKQDFMSILTRNIFPKTLLNSNLRSITTMSAPFVGRAQLGKTVFFCCDVQERFHRVMVLSDTRGVFLGQPIYAFEEMASTGEKLMKAASILNIPVIATEQNPKALGSTISQLTTLFPEPPTLTKTFPKTKFSMVIPEVIKLLEDKDGAEGRDWETVVIFGIEAHVCVLQTALDLLFPGASSSSQHPEPLSNSNIKPRRVYIIRDGISSCNRGEVDVAVERMRQAGAVITTSESLLFELLSDSSHPSFKPISSLVKQTLNDTKSSVRKLVVETGGENGAGSRL